LQTLNYHKKCVYKIIELKNNILVSCSADSYIIFYLKDNIEYKKDFLISARGSCSSINQTKDNEICYSESKENRINFFDLSERKIKAKISNISKYNGIRERLIMLKNNFM